MEGAENRSQGWRPPSELVNMLQGHCRSGPLSF